MNLDPGQEQRCRRRDWICGHSGGRGVGWDELGDLDWHIHTTLCKQRASGKLLYAQGAQLGALWWPRGVGRCGLVGEVQEEAGICIHIAGSLRCTVESNTMLKSNYTTIKKTPHIFKPLMVCLCQMDSISVCSIRNKLCWAHAVGRPPLTCHDVRISDKGRGRGGSLGSFAHMGPAGKALVTVFGGLGCDSHHHRQHRKVPCSSPNILHVSEALSPIKTILHSFLVLGNRL